MKFAFRYGILPVLHTWGFRDESNPFREIVTSRKVSVTPSGPGLRALCYLCPNKCTGLDRGELKLSDVMKISTGKKVRGIIALGFFVAVFGFWWGVFPEILAFHEQMQLFLWTPDYFCSRLAEPGGLARYIGEFVVQFYNSITFGALLLAGLFLLMQQMTCQLLQKEGAPVILGNTLSLIPPILLLAVMCNENIPLAFLIAILMAEATMLFLPRGRKQSMVYLVVMIPCGYWLMGPAVFMLVIAAGLQWFSNWKSPLQASLASVVMVLFFMVCVEIISRWTPYPLLQLFRGIDYDRLPREWLIGETVFMVFLAILPFAVYRLRSTFSHVQGTKRERVFSFVILVAAIGGVVFAWAGKSDEEMTYNLLLRRQDWTGIVTRADHTSPVSPVCRCVVALASWKMQRISASELQYTLNETHGILTDQLASTMMTDVYFMVGMVNVAQKFAFESMELIPDHNLSGRLLKRLAETNLVCRQYRVARKYLTILQGALFYRQWATGTLWLLDHKALIDRHPVYGALRKCLPRRDIVFL